jgi:hypothetical protein
MCRTCWPSRYTGSYQSFGYGTALAVPLLREGDIGVFVLTRDA